MRVTSLSLLAAAVGAASLTACAPAIRSQRDETIPVPQGARWAWEKAEAAAARPQPGDTAPPEVRGAVRRPGNDPTAARAIPRQRFHRALETALEARGFQKVEDRTQADFLLGLAFESPGRPGPARVTTGIGIGWGGRPWGRGWVRPWGPYEPWGGWLWAPWGFGWYGVPYWGVAAYPVYQVPARGLLVVAVLRERSSGEVAWRAQYRADAYDLAYLTERHAQEIADKLVASLH